MITSPRSGVGLTCGVAVLPATGGSDDDLGWNSGRPRARLAPQAEAWAAGCSVSARRGELPARPRSKAYHRPEIGLDEIDLCALDVVFELDGRDAGQSGVLERRVLSQVRARAGANASVALATGGRAASWALLSSLVKRIGVCLPQRSRCSHPISIRSASTPIPRRARPRSKGL